jgi:DNA-binding ferritin-like protein
MVTQWQEQDFISFRIIVMKKINESMQVLIVTEPNQEIILDNMMAEWSGLPYSQLSVLLVYLKFLAVVHQNHHWTCMGDPFYGDHLLFSKLYEAVDCEIDPVAEKVIGLGCTSNVNPQLMHSQILKLLTGAGAASTIPQTSDLARKSLMVELNFLKLVDSCRSSLEESGLLTNGVDNMLQGIADKHEGHVYLLKQRCTKETV